jgi:hypothetical protein
MGWYGQVLGIFVGSFPNFQTHPLIIRYESVQNFSHASQYKQKLWPKNWATELALGGL